MINPDKTIKDRRYKEMVHLKEELCQEYKILKQYAFNERMNKDLFRLLEYRLKKVRIRPYYTQIIYRYLLETKKSELSENLNNFFNIKLPFISEVIITIQYYHNQMLDHKDNIDKDKKRYKCHILGADILKHCLFEYIEDLKALSFDQKRYLVKEVRKIFKYVDVGQYVEKEWGIYNKLHNISEDEECFFISNEIEEFINNDVCDKIFDWVKDDIHYHLYLKAYLRRIYLTCGTLYIKIVEIIVNLVGMKDKQVSHDLLEFARNFSLMRQIMNDYSDFVPEHLLPRKGEGQIYNSFSDLRNHTITLPTLFHFNNAEYTFDGYFIDNDEVNSKKVFEDLKKSYGLHKTITITRLLRNDCETILRRNEISTELMKIFIDVLDIVNINKFHSAIKKDKKIYRKYQKTIFYNICTSKNNQLIKTPNETSISICIF